MKKMTENFKNILFVIVLLSFSSNIFANDSNPNLKIINSGKKIFKLIGGDAKSTSVTIRIFDEEGFNLLEEKVALDGRHSKSYDFSNLPKGTYEVEIEDAAAFRKYIVTTTSDNLNIVENGEEKIYKPIISLKDNFVLLNMLNLNSKDISITINNNSGEEIYAEEIQNMKTIHKSYSLTNLPSGKYLVGVKTSTKFFNVEVNLK